MFKKIVDSHEFVVMLCLKILIIHIFGLFVLLQPENM